jgi:hypothetical protein
LALQGQLKSFCQPYDVAASKAVDAVTDYTAVIPKQFVSLPHATPELALAANRIVSSVTEVSDAKVHRKISTVVVGFTTDAASGA